MAGFEDTDLGANKEIKHVGLGTQVMRAESSGLAWQRALPTAGIGAPPQPHRPPAGEKPPLQKGRKDILRREFVATLVMDL